jgi:hypothetical protein
MSLTKTSYSMISGALVNVADYGASSSATAAVNTAAFIAALAAATSASTGEDPSGNPAGTVFVPRGRYQINPDQIIIPNWVNLKGAGKTATQLVAATAGTTLLRMGTAADPTYRTSISDLTFFGNGLNLTGLSIYASLWFMYNVEVNAFNYHGIYLYSSYTGKAYNTFVYYCATSAGYAGIYMTGVSSGSGVNDVNFFGGALSYCYDSIRIQNCNGVVFDGMSIQSSKRNAINLDASSFDVTGVTFQNGYFEANCDTFPGSIFFGAFTKVTIANNYFAGSGAFQTKAIAANSGYNQCTIINNIFDTLPTQNPAFIGLVDEAAVSIVFVRNLIIGNSSSNDAIPLFTPALKVFADAALYPTNAVPLSRVDHAVQYQIQSNFVSVYTVTMTPSTSGTITLAPTSNTGGYSKTGRVVHAQGSVTVASVSSPVGTNVLISLPAPISDLDEDGEKIGGVVIQSSANILPFIGNGAITGFYMIIDAATVAAAQTYSWSFSYITNSGTP